MKQLAATRRAALIASRSFQEFSADVSDLKVWLAEKLKTAADESYRDLANIERKLQKHEAFERELRANEGQLHSVNKVNFSTEVFTFSDFELFILSIQMFQMLYDYNMNSCFIIEYQESSSYVFFAFLTTLME